MSAFSFTDTQYADHLAAVEAALSRLRADNIDSRTLYGRVSGNAVLWSAPRRAQQRALIRRLWDAQSAIPAGDGRVYLLAGVPGAGKTTVRRDPQNGLDQGWVVVDPDEIAATMIEQGLVPHVDGLSPMETAPLIHEEAWELAERLAQLAYHHRRDVLWEIPLSSPPDARLAAVIAAGYRPGAGFVETPADIARERILIRHRAAEEDYRNGRGNGGFFIPAAVHDAGGPTPQTPAPPQPPKFISGQPDSVKGLVEQFAFGGLAFDDLLERVAARRQAASSGAVSESADWGEVYRRCEQLPDDDAPLWIGVAEDRGALTTEQAEALFTRIEDA